MTDSPYDWPVGAFGAAPLFERSHKAYRWALAQYEAHLWTFRLSPDVEYRLRKATEDARLWMVEAEQLDVSEPLPGGARPAPSLLLGIPVEVDRGLPPDTILLRREKSF